MQFSSVSFIIPLGKIPKNGITSSRHMKTFVPLGSLHWFILRITSIVFSFAQLTPVFQPICFYVLQSKILTYIWTSIEISIDNLREAWIVNKGNSWRIRIQVVLRPYKTVVQDCFVVLTWSCLTLWGPMDCSLPGSSVHGIFQQEYGSRLPFPTSGNLPDPDTEPISLTSAGEFFTTSATWKAPTL